MVDKLEQLAHAEIQRRLEAAGCSLRSVDLARICATRTNLIQALHFF